MKTSMATVLTAIHESILTIYAMSRDKVMYVSTALKMNMYG
jgi:hypothetical protein